MMSPMKKATNARKTTHEIRKHNLFLVPPFDYLQQAQMKNTIDKSDMRVMRQTRTM